MSLNDVKLAVINADLGTTGSLNDQEKAFYDAALAGGGTSSNPAIFKPDSGVAVTIDQDNDAISLDIDTESSGSSAIRISAVAMTTGSIINCQDANALTTGSMLRLISDSPSTAIRSIISIANGNSAATATTCVKLRQDSASSFLELTGVTGANTTSAISTLTISGTVSRHVQINVGGTKLWLAALNDPS